MGLSCADIAQDNSAIRNTNNLENLIIIQVPFIPLKFSYAKYQGTIIDDDIIAVIQNMASEKNSIVEKYNSLKIVSNTALQSQALLQLKNEYCNKNKCLQCAIGNILLTGNV